MATDEATVTETEFDDGTKTLGDQLVGLTLLEAKSLADYLKEVHGIEPASGGVVMAMGSGGGDGGGDAATASGKSDCSSDVTWKNSTTKFCSILIIGIVSSRTPPNTSYG